MSNNEEENPESSNKFVKMLKLFLNHSIIGFKIWEVVGTLLAVMTMLTGIYSYLTTTKIFSEAHEYIVQSGLQVLIGDVKGKMVYEGLRKDFLSYKTNMDYRVQISDKPFPTSHVGEQLKNGQYYFFKANLDFNRIQPNIGDEVIIAAITDTDKLAEWIKKSNVIFREVIGINPDDRAYVDKILSEVDTSNEVSEKVIKMSNIFDVNFYINGLTITPTDVRKEASGYSFVYKLPKLANSEGEINYKFTYISLQKKDITTFPFIVSEPTQFLNYKVELNLQNLKNIHHFSAFVTGASSGNPHIELDKDNKVFEISSTRKEWLFPGSGSLLYWTQ